MVPLPKTTWLATMRSWFETLRRHCHPLCQTRTGCHRLDHRFARLHPARGLTAEAVELAIGGEDA